MKLSTFKQKYHNKYVEDAYSVMSAEAKALARDFKALIKDYFKDYGFVLENWSTGHYFVSGFIKKDDVCIFINWDIPRYETAIDIYSAGYWDGVLFREAENEKDYTGKTNNFSSIAHLQGKVLALSERIEKQKRKMEENTYESCSNF